MRGLCREKRPLASPPWFPLSFFAFDCVCLSAGNPDAQRHWAMAGQEFKNRALKPLHTQVTLSPFR